MRVFPSGTNSLRHRRWRHALAHNGQSVTRDVWCCAVVFGYVVEGMDVVKQIESVGTASGKPSQPVVIADAGELSA